MLQTPPSARPPARPSGTVLTARHLGRMLALVVLLAAAEELLAAAARAHVLNAHVDALVDDPPVDLQDAVRRGAARSGRGATVLHACPAWWLLPRESPATS